METPNVPSKDKFAMLTTRVLILLASCSLCFLLLDFSLLKDPEKTAARVDRLLFIASSAPELRSIDFNASLHDDSASVAVTVQLPGPKPYYHFVEIIVVLDMTHQPMITHACYNPKHQANRGEIFSLRANAWKEIEGIHFPYIHFYYTNNNPERSFSEMHLPVEFDYDNLNFCHLRVLGESPHLCAVLGCKHSVKIRVMKEYKVQSSWTKSLRGQLQEHRTYCNSSYRSEVAVYTESLFSLPCDSE
ncbi:hypothetical protein HKD37_05G013548 [Glycine soja]